MTTNGRPRDLPSLTATLGGGGNAEAAFGAVSSTLVGVGGGVPPVRPRVELDDTLGDDEGTAAAANLVGGTAASGGRTTVLPRRKRAAASEAASVEQRRRFDRMRLLGKGAMGAVELVRDNDIRRTVAVKRLLSEGCGEAAALRFADEVRIVGQLEHPGIVPVYDVGRDEQGDVYLVMKHLEGETMEAVIEKLRGGDRAYADRFTIEQRVSTFLGILDAIRYAHARGIIHRDLKPANIMIGQYGEVTVMDWGIAKPIAGRQAVGVHALDRTLSESQDQRLLETQLGTLAGTPLYMSPEQAAGRNDELDERSDVYALSVLLCEWLMLEHPLSDKTTVTEVLAAIISNDPDEDRLLKSAIRANVGMDLLQVITRGMNRLREERFQSVAELEDALKKIQAGEIPIRCHITFAKRSAHAFAHWIDRNFLVFTTLVGLTALGVVGTLGYGIYRIIRAMTS